MRPRDLAADLGHHLHRHGFIALVVQVQHGAPVGMVAHHAFEGGERPVRGPLHPAGEFARVDRLPRQREDASLRLDAMGIAAGAPAHRRQQRDLVPVADLLRARREALVPRQQDAGLHLPQPRKLPRIVLQHAPHARARTEFQSLLRPAGNVL